MVAAPASDRPARGWARRTQAPAAARRSAPGPGVDRVEAPERSSPLRASPQPAPARDLPAEAASAFEEQMVAHCAAFSPGIAATLGADSAPGARPRGHRPAAEHGLTLKGPVRLFIELGLLFGGDFDREPWARACLGAGSTPRPPGRSTRPPRRWTARRRSTGQPWRRWATMVRTWRSTDDRCPEASGACLACRDRRTHRPQGRRRLFGDGQRHRGGLQRQLSAVSRADHRPSSSPPCSPTPRPDGIQDTRAAFNQAFEKFELIRCPRMARLLRPGPPGGVDGARRRRREEHELHDPRLEAVFGGIQRGSLRGSSITTQ